MVLKKRDIKEEEYISYYVFSKGGNNASCGIAGYAPSLVVREIGSFQTCFIFILVL